jgi:hypothetical protein
MNIFEVVDEVSKTCRLPCLIIGGHAVNAYGYSRFTEDVDILVCKNQRETWLSALAEKGFTLDHDGGGFLQMKSPANLSPLDLMLVAPETFEKLCIDTKTVQLGGRNLRVPALESLFALKFHVLKQEVPRRGYKDLMDVLSLADCNGVDLRSDKIGCCAKSLVAQRFMNDSSHLKDELREIATPYRAKIPDLELPVASRFNPPAPTLGSEEYVEWCNRMRKDFSKDTAAERLALKTGAEFVWP